MKVTEELNAGFYWRLFLERIEILFKISNYLPASVNSYLYFIKYTGETSAVKLKWTDIFPEGETTFVEVVFWCFAQAEKKGIGWC